MDNLPLFLLVTLSKTNPLYNCIFVLCYRMCSTLETDSKMFKDFFLLLAFLFSSCIPEQVKF